MLVAEDDPFIAAELQGVLADEGAEVMGPVPTVRAAMAAIEAGKPDVALLDVNLRDAELGARSPRRCGRQTCPWCW